MLQEISPTILDPQVLLELMATLSVTLADSGLRVRNTPNKRWMSVGRKSSSIRRCYWSLSVRKHIYFHRMNSFMEARIVASSNWVQGCCGPKTGKRIRKKKTLSTLTEIRSVQNLNFSYLVLIIKKCTCYIFQMLNIIDLTITKHTSTLMLKS